MLDTVERLTGYPRDLLDTDLDLEADLGIDTVKQAEVFASVRAAFGIARDENLRLRDFPTLGHVIGFARERSAHVLNGSGPADAAPGKQEQATHAPAALPDLVPAFTADMAGAERLPRRLPVPVLRPPASWCKPTGVVLDGASRVIVMADDGGVAQALARRLTSLGATALMLEPGSADLAGRWIPGWPMARCKVCTGSRPWTPRCRSASSTWPAGTRRCAGG